MKKVLGYLLIIVFSLINLIILLGTIPVATDFATFLVMIFMLIPGALLIWLGVKMVKKKNPKEQVENYTTSNQNNQINEESENTDTLSEIKQHTEQKLSAMPMRGYPVSENEIYEAYLNFNDEKLPFSFFKSENSKSHITAHWKFGDADYLGIMGLSKHNIQKEFNVLIKFDSKKSQVRCMDYAKSSSTGFSAFGGGMEFSSFSGKQSSVSKEIHFGRKKDGSFGKVADMILDTRILHNAIEEIADKNGWKVKRVVKL